MQSKDIKGVFQNEYDRHKWCSLLSGIFGSSAALSSSNPKKETINNEKVKGSFELGEIEIEDRKIKVCEVILDNSIDLEKNRVGIRNIMRQYWKHNDGSFIVYHSANKPKQWRFSYIQEKNVFIEKEGKTQIVQTEPKRYTYLLGRNENVVTATERFEKLKLKPTLENIKEAFSVEKLSNEFFKKYKELYSEFCEYLGKNYKNVEPFNKDSEGKAIRDFCKKMLGRIVFLYFVQKKGWLAGDSNYLANLFEENKENFYSRELSKLFFETLNNPSRDRDSLRKIPFLNGGLFERDFEKSNYLIDFDSNLFKKLFDFFGQYNFTIDENVADNEQTVGIDPEMLSKIFENLLEDNKEKGAYYTPKEIVKYMCEESLTEYLTEKTKFKREEIESLIKNRGRSYNEEEKNLINSVLDNIKICDPAIGSGAFPMGMLNLIFSIKEILDPNIDRAKTKLDIIQNSIYGVDIEKGAVDIARLRFWLSLIIDETEPKPLPNLDFKIVQGDSLVSKFEGEVISINWDILYGKVGSLYIDNAGKLKENFVKLMKKQREFFYESNKDKKEKIKKEIRNLKIEILESQIKIERENYNARYSEKGSLFEHSNRNAVKNLEIQARKSTFKKILDRLAKLKNNDEYLEFFDWKLDFSEIMNPMQELKTEPLNEAVGFDIVIGNPPYVFARNSKLKGITDADKSYFYKNYILSEYQINLYPLFIEKGTNNLKDNGILCFITPNNWLTLNTNKQLRQFVLKQSNVTILNFYKRIFESADVDSAIVIYNKNNTNTTNEKIKLAEWEKEYALIGEIEKEKILNSKDFVINIEALKGNETFDLLEKIENKGSPLAEIADVKVGLKAYQTGKGHPKQTEEIKKGRIFHSKIEGKDYIKYLEGSDVCRYFLNWSGEFLKYGKHLAEPRTNFDIFSTSRILVRQIPSPLPYCINACFTSETLLNDLNSMNIIYIKISPLYLLGVLNSRIISYWFVHKFGKLQRGIFPQFKINELAQFPIPNISVSQQKPIISLVEKILSAKKKNTTADTYDLERQIDELVYKLYGLTEKEIAVIEQKQ